MNTTWKPTAGGILAIVGGAINLLVGLSLTLFFPMAMPFRSALLAVGVFDVLFLGTGIVALIGGINAVQRRRWGLSLAGAICAILSPAALLGIMSTVFIAMARAEFPLEPVQPAAAGQPQIAAGEMASDTGAADVKCHPDFTEPSEGERNA